MVIRVLPFFVLCLFFQIKSMEDCAAVPNSSTIEFDFDLVFTYPTEQESNQELIPIKAEEKQIYNTHVADPRHLIGSQYVESSVLKGMNAVNVLPNNSIKKLIQNHFRFRNIKAEHVMTYLEANPHENINSKDKFGRTLLDVAVDLEDTKLIEYLKRNGADLDQIDNNCLTIYQRSIARGVRDDAILNLLYSSKG